MDWHYLTYIFIAGLIALISYFAVVCILFMINRKTKKAIEDHYAGDLVFDMSTPDHKCQFIFDAPVESFELDDYIVLRVKRSM